MLSRLMLRFEYRSDEVVLARDLYERCLPLSSRFDRAVGFFSSSVFAACPSAFREFFGLHGRMRVVCSPVLDRHDIDAMVRGYRDKPKLVRQPQLSIFEQKRQEIIEKRFNLISWLIATGNLEIKVAIRTSPYEGHLYHEKLGLFRDDDGNTLAFAGSANESLPGLEGNFESVDVFRSWEPEERKRLQQKLISFEQLWSDETDGLEICSFPEAARRGLLSARTEQTRLPVAPASQGPTQDIVPIERPIGIEETLAIPSEIGLQEHQKIAIRSWFQSQGRGILEMATGSGKTITALAIATKLYESVDGPLLVLIVCPFLHLCSQWIEEAKRFGLDPLLCAIDRREWLEPASTRLFNLVGATRRIGSIVASNATFATPAFQAMLQRIPPKSLIIADEVHNLGARQLQRCLPNTIEFRLGLSATPDRQYDLIGTSAIRAYFGDSVIQYTLAQALQDGVLCPYRYYPILVPLDDDELDDYLELTRKIGQIFGTVEDPDDSAVLQALLLKRARLLGTARRKVPALIAQMSPLKNTTHNLIYCGDGSVEQPADETLSRHVDAVVRAVGRDLGMSVAKYVADTPLTRRHHIRRMFAEGAIQGLVAIRCLDEGVDIPEIRRAFILASSTNPRQFIQRRGRILRRAPDKSFAEIYDFIVEPPAEEASPSSPLYQTMRKLFRRELHRIVEFASLASNGPEALHALLPLRNRLGLLDF